MITTFLTHWLMTKAIKFGSLFLSFIFAQTAQVEPLISTAFDQMFSLGLLVVFIIVLWKEYKATQKVIASYRENDTATRRQMVELLEQIKDKLDGQNDGS